MRNSFLKFGGFWTLQAFIVLLTSLPGIMVLNYDANLLMDDNAISLASWILLIRLFGWVIEAIDGSQENRIYTIRTNNKERAADEIIRTG